MRENRFPPLPAARTATEYGQVRAGSQDSEPVPNRGQALSGSPGSPPFRENREPGLTNGTDIGLVRATISTLRGLFTNLPGQAIHGRQAYHEHGGLLGGDATVMLTPASPRWDADRVRVVTADPGDVRPPLDVLVYWARVIAAGTSTLVGPLPTVADACGYHDRQLDQTIRLDIWPSYAKDIGRLLHSVENVVHAGHRPDVSRVPCWDCGTRLQRVWTDSEAHDYWRCPGCGELYDHGRYERAKHDQLHSRGADRFVALVDAVAATGRPEQTVRAWVVQGLVETRKNPGGPREVWWPDVRDRHRITPIRKRA